MLNTKEELKLSESEFTSLFIKSVLFCIKYIQNNDVKISSGEMKYDENNSYIEWSHYLKKDSKDYKKSNIGIVNRFDMIHINRNDNIFNKKTHFNRFETKTKIECSFYWLKSGKLVNDPVTYDDIEFFTLNEFIKLWSKSKRKRFLKASYDLRNKQTLESVQKFMKFLVYQLNMNGLKHIKIEVDYDLKPLKEQRNRKLNQLLKRK